MSGRLCSLRSHERRRGWRRNGSDVEFRGRSTAAGSVGAAALCDHRTAAGRTAAAGELHEALTVLAAKTWRHPFTGLDVRFGVSTIERWLYAAKRAADPVRALRNQVRRDIGRFPSLSAEAVQALTAQYREHPGWTAQLHHDNLRVTLAAAGTKCPSYPSVRRYLKAQGLLRRRPPKRRRPRAPSPPVTGSNNARCAATKSSTSCSSCTWTSITARARC